MAKSWNPKIQEALELMRAGLNSVEAGERLGINPATIRAYLFKHKEEREGMPIGRGRPGPGPETPKALALMRTGISSREAARRLGVSSGGIRAYLHRNKDERHGILPPKGGQSERRSRVPNLCPSARLLAKRPGGARRANPDWPKNHTFAPSEIGREVPFQ